MKKLIPIQMKVYKALSFLLFFGFQLVFAASIVSAETKVIDKTFQVDSQVELQIDNRYGNLNLSTWNKNTIEFHIEIKVDGTDPQAVKERINAITVDFSNSASLVAAITKIGSVSNRNRSNMRIQYFVKLPKSAKINIKNMYGNFAVDQLNGSALIDLKYGNMTVGNLNHSNNQIKLQYVTSADISSIKSAKIQADYSNFTLAKSEAIELKANYSNCDFESAKTVVAELKYGNLKADKIQQLTAESKYTNFKINQLTQQLKIHAGYGNIMVNEVGAAFRSVDIEASYADVSLGMAKNAGYQLKGDFSYGDLKYPESLSMHKAIKSTSKKSYEGTTGHGTGKITLGMRYGNARIK